VDDATTEAVAIVPARALGGLAVTRVLDRLAATRGLPRVLRTACYQRLCQGASAVGRPIEMQMRAAA
jgi:putative transposase